ncbi:hypothetical protein HMPREF3291_01485 [Bacillus sp. HMSC76G11]|nr:hypothetical protein HMPREF3291_01485 [Bacillus sp. HMSC76G11]
MVVIAPLLPEIYLNMRSKAFTNADEVYSSTKDLIVAAVLYNVVFEALFGGVLSVFIRYQFHLLKPMLKSPL